MSSGVSAGSSASIWCWWNQPTPIRVSRCMRPAESVERAGRQLGEGGLAGAVDAEQPDAVVDVEPQIHVAQHRRRRHSRRWRASSRISGGASGRAGEGSVKGATRSAETAATGSSLASRFMRDCACAALLALARKRSTKLCRCARSASCLTRVAACSRAFSATRRSKSS